jgi:hypothetical protein
MDALSFVFRDTGQSARNALAGSIFVAHRAGT